MVMVKEKDFLIQFSGLKAGEHRFEYHIENDFFDLFNYDEFNNVNINVEAILLKKETMMELFLSHKGTVNVPCDVTNEDFDLSVNGSLKLIVKFGEEFNNDNEELLILPHEAFQFSLAQFIYEMIVLSVPYKRVHPSIADDYETEDEFSGLDFLDDEDLEMIHDDGLTDTENETTGDDSPENKETDPRWDELKKLLTDK